MVSFLATQTDEPELARYIFIFAQRLRDLMDEVTILPSGLGLDDTSNLG
ncbi:hypothetical protein [Novosphingobium terrae]|nr:hypothetical protein [Novosphingobium terrae]